MSRTDVHRPWDIQAADPTNRHLLYRYQEWPWRDGLTSFRNLGCGCRLCTGHYARRQEHRRQRTEWRNLRQQLLATRDVDTLDVPPPKRTW